MTTGRPPRSASSGPRRSRGPRPAAAGLAGVAAFLAAASASAPLAAQEADSLPIRPAGSPLVISRGWLPAASVTLAFPASSNAHPEGLLVQASDGALLAAMREATSGRLVGFHYDRDAAGRYFVASCAAEALEAVLGAMQRAARAPLPARLAEEAVAALGADLAFRGDLPRSRFDRALDAHLRGEAQAPDSAAGTTTDLEGLAATVAEIVPAARWGPPVWVVVDDVDAPGGARPPALPQPVAADPPVATGTPARIHVPGDAVTRWTGSVFRHPPGTTLLEARFVQLVLEEVLEGRRDPSLFEFNTDIDADGRLVVRLSTSADASTVWEARLDDAVRRLGFGEDGFRLGEFLPPARSRWSRELAPAAGAGRAAADALLRGATDAQALAYAHSAANPPPGDRLQAVARGMMLEVRVVYGSS